MPRPPEGRMYNFSPGPCCLPYEVLSEAQREITNYQNSGISIMEMSHRSKMHEKIQKQCIEDLRSLMDAPPNYKVLLMHGGGCGQFAAVPLNLLSSRQEKAAYCVTGMWSQKAADEAKKFAAVTMPVNDRGCVCVPAPADLRGRDEKYFYYCANETASGVEFKYTPSPRLSDGGRMDVVSDMSSNFLSKPIDVANHAVFFAGAQKNVGTAGLVIVVLREDILQRQKQSGTPSIMDYKVIADSNSLFNTPPCWNVYITGLMCQHLRRYGDLRAWEKLSAEKARRVYGVIDSSDGFYRNAVDPSCRSNMNVVFRLRTDELESQFLEEAVNDHMLLGLKGHRTIGGIRASLYNGMSLEGVEALVSFMASFHEKHSQRE